MSAARLDPTGRTRRLAVFTARLFALFVLVWLGLGTTTSAPRTEPFGVLVADGRPERLVDFASHRNFACAAWSGDLAREGGTSIYTLDAHLKATARWTGMPAEIALPFGYSPTMLWVLGPLCALPGRSAYVAWSVVSILAAGWLILRVRAHWMVPLVLVTPLTLGVFALGQTALLTTAGLFFLMTSETEGEAARSLGSWARSVVLWLLTAKPPLALAASVALLAGGRGRIVLRAAALTLVSTLALTPWLGGGWVRDYLHLLGSYDRVRLPAAFAWSITPRLMSNLRAALHSDLGLADDLAVRLSTVAWGAGLVAVALAAWRRRIAGGPVWALCILAYLLLCPHVSLTEDVALFCVLVGVEGARLPGAFRLGAVLLALIGLLLNPGIGPVSGHRPSVLFFAKLVLLAYVLAAAHREAAATPARRRGGHSGGSTRTAGRRLHDPTGCGGSS